MKRTLFFVYEAKQVAALRSFLEAGATGTGEYNVVALRADVEPLLKKEGQVFSSAAKYRNPDASSRLSLTEHILQRIETDKVLKTLRHRGLSLVALQAIIIQDYLTELLYWLEVIAGAIREHDPEEVIVWSPWGTIHEENILAHRVIGAIPRSVSMAAQQHGCAVTILPHLGKKYFWPQKYMFLLSRNIFSVVLFVVNVCVRACSSPRPVKVLVADSWRNAGPYAAKLSDVEMVMYDRMEVFKVSWKDMLAHRLQFKDASSYKAWSDRMIATSAQRQCFELWGNQGGSVDSFSDIEWKGIPLAAELHAMLSQYVEHSVAADVCEIERINRILTVTHPDVVMVRASAARQTHLMMLCQLAEALGIPSIESQHGWYYVGEAGTHRRSVSANMATYGPLCSTEMDWCGYKGKCVAVGSPRFDVYHSVMQQPSTSQNLNVLIGLFDDITGRWTDTYDIYNLIQSIKQLLDSTDNIEVTLKVKPNSPFGDLGVQWARHELSEYENFHLVDNRPMHELLAETDVTVTVFSTIILESMLVGRPVIFWAEPPFHNALGKSPQMDVFKRESGIALAHDIVELQHTIELLRPEQVRANKGQQARDFMAKHFSLTPGSSERMVKCILDTIGQ